MAEQTNGQNGWPEYRRLVLKELEDGAKALDQNTRAIEGLRAEMARMASELSSIKTQVRIYSGGAGAIVGFIVTALIAVVKEAISK